MNSPGTPISPVAVLRISLQAPAPEAPWQRHARQFLAGRVATAALVLFAVLAIVAFSAPWIAPQDPYDLAVVTVVNSELAPGSASATGDARFLLGTDGAGRDVLSAILYGLRISISIGMLSALVALLVGTTVGLMAAYFGGKVDAVLMRLVDMQLSIPTVLAALVILALLGPGVDKTMIALVIVQWAYYARNVRGTAQVERKKEYIEAAIGQGLPAWRIMFRHILPNCLPPLIVIVTLQTGHAISIEATMSFLGIGLPATKPSLGLLIANGFEYMLSNKYWISVFPGIALVLLIASINLIGDQLRTVLNPRLET